MDDVAPWVSANCETFLLGLWPEEAVVDQFAAVQGKFALKGQESTQSISGSGVLVPWADSGVPDTAPFASVVDGIGNAVGDVPTQALWHLICRKFMRV